jgi:flagella basal body P-ring formation protein FlgA
MCRLPRTRIVVALLLLAVGVARGALSALGSPALGSPGSGSPALGSPALGSPADAAVRAAIERAVQERMGDDAHVTVRALVVRASADMAERTTRPAQRHTPSAERQVLRAVPVPGARTGRPVLFGLFEGPRRVGSATATVTATLPHVRVSAPLSRDGVVTTAGTAVAIGVVDGVRLERLPSPAELVGARARRDVAPGEPVTGDEVEVVARVGSVEARGVGRVSGSGHVGEWVRVAGAGERRLQPARVVAPGVVELRTARHVRPPHGGGGR